MSRPRRASPGGVARVRWRSTACHWTAAISRTSPMISAGGQRCREWRAVATTRLSDLNRSRDFSVEVSFVDNFKLDLELAAQLAQSRLNLGGSITNADVVAWQLRGTFPATAAMRSTT